MEVRSGIQLWNQRTKCQLFLWDVVGTNLWGAGCGSGISSLIISVRMICSTIFPEWADS